MAKLNKSASVEKIVKEHPDRTENYEGGIAFTMDDKTKLYSQVATCLVNEPKFYGEKDTQVNEILDGIEKVASKDPEFILRLAAYTRNELYLRSIPVVLLVEAANLQECKPFVRKWAPSIINRADELTEAIAYQLHRFKKPIPNCLKKSLADCFQKFDEYQFAKYDRDGTVKLKDVARIVHPIPANDERAELYKRLVNREMKIPDTWETYISANGSTKENWEKIFPKMGYMAVLRNLRNFLDKECDMKPMIALLSDEKKVKNSKQLPFRFFSAYRSIEDNKNPLASTLLDALEDALEISAENIPRMEGTTLLSADNSGSMYSTMSERSTVEYADVANLMQSLAHKFCEIPITSVFGQNFAVVNVSKRGGILNNMRKFGDTDVGYSTNGYLAVRYLRDQKVKVDRIMIFTDCQLYDSTPWGSDYSLAEELKKYKSEINPNVFTYVVDLSGYGTIQIPQNEPKTALIAGWNDKVFRFIKIFEKEKKTAVDEISKLNEYISLAIEPRKTKKKPKK